MVATLIQPWRQKGKLHTGTDQTTVFCLSIVDCTWGAFSPSWETGQEDGRTPAQFISRDWGKLGGTSTWSPCLTKGRSAPSVRTRDYPILTVVLHTTTWINGMSSSKTLISKASKQSDKGLMTLTPTTNKAVSLPSSLVTVFLFLNGSRRSYCPKGRCRAPSPSSLGPLLSLLF